MPEPIFDGVRRLSSLGGRLVSADSTMTLEDQDAGLKAAAEAAGGRLGRVFDAIDHSGFTFAGSELMDAILARVEHGESDGLAFAYFDRNGRNWWDQGPFFKRLEAADGRYVVRGMEAIDYRTPLGRQVFGGMAVASETPYFAAKQRGDNIVEGIMARKVPNRVSYGYKRNGTFIDGKLAGRVDEARDAKALVFADEIEVVKRIFRMRLDGFGQTAIARTLNGDGIPGPRETPWRKTTVGSIVANEIYKGVLVFGRIRRDRSKGTNIRRIPVPELAVVSAHDWQRAQSTRTLQRTGKYRAGVAGGILTCSGCRQTLVVIGSSDERYSYGCRRETAAGDCPRPVYVKKDAADDYVDEIVEQALGGLPGIDAVASSRRTEQTRAALEAALAERLALTDKVKPSHPDFAAWVEMADAEIDAAQAEHDAALATSGALTELPTAAEYRKRPVLGRNRIARQLLRSVTVAPPVSRSKFAPVRERFDPDFLGDDG